MEAGLPKFNKCVVYPELIAIQNNHNKKIIGYVNKHPYEKGWFWFSDINLSNFFNNADDAIADLIRENIITSLDNKAKKLNIYNNENYVKGR